MVRGIDNPKIRPRFAAPSEVEVLPPTEETEDDKIVKPSGLEEATA